MVLIKSYFTETLSDCSKLTYVYWNYGDQDRDCYSCLNLMVKAHLLVAFFKMFFIIHVSVKRLF